MKKKSLSAKKIVAKNFNFIKILRDKKIFGIFNNFTKNFDALKLSNKVGISVSGGPDSMALCFLINCYKYKINNKIKPFFYLVDHGIRSGSAKEALEVKKYLKLYRINLKILKWIGKKPSSNIQSLARDKRYNLLFDECRKSNIKTILTAHHQDDFYETFFSRLLRGSGTEGLSSFADQKKVFKFKKDNITIARPLLNLSKENLIYVSKHVFNFYIEDPSNEMEIFQRVRLRKLIINLKNQGLNFEKLKLTLNNLASTNRAINEIVNYNISNNIYVHKKKIIINSNFFQLPEEIIFRSLSILIKRVGKKNYPPRGKKMVSLIKQLKKSNRHKATLGGTIIEKLHNSVVVAKEKTKKS